MESELFRTAMRGFNRTDVVQFIQRQTLEHEKTVRALQDENRRLKQDVAKAESERNALVIEKQSLQREATDLRAKVTVLEAENALMAEKVRNAPQRSDSPLDAPIAPSPMLPNTFDEMELSAYRRAELTERMARERALASTERMKQIFAQSFEKLSLLEGDYGVLLDACRNDFTQLQELLQNAQSILSESSDGLRAAQTLCESL